MAEYKSKILERNEDLRTMVVEYTSAGRSSLLMGMRIPNDETKMKEYLEANEPPVSYDDEEEVL